MHTAVLRLLFLFDGVLSCFSHVLLFWDAANCSPPGSSVPGIFLAGILEWVAMPSFRGSSQPRDWTHVSFIAGKLLCCWATMDRGAWQAANHGVTKSWIIFVYLLILFWASKVALGVKNLPASAGDVRDVGSILRSGISCGEGNGNPLQYSCLENPMDRGALWGCTRVHDWSNLACMHAWYYFSLLGVWFHLVWVLFVFTQGRAIPRASLVAQLVKNPLAMREMWVRSLGWEDPLEKGKATHSSTLTWRIPWTV